MVKPIFWHQGLFLQPHHFQLNELYSKSTTTPFYRFMAPHFWGTASYEIDEGLLANSVFDLKAGEFFFPDNTNVLLGENALIQARSFEKEWEDGGKPFSVYLGLKKWEAKGENVAVLSDSRDLANVSNRFIFSGSPEEIPDQHGKGPSAEIKHLQFLIKIFWETEIEHRGEYQLIQIARLKKNLEQIVVDPDFIPPSLSIFGSKTLSGIVKEIRDQIFSKTRQLEAVKRDKGVHTAEFGSRDMVYMMALRSLNRYTPLLTHLTGTIPPHPWTIYGVLRQIIGELSSFSAEISANGERMDGSSLITEYDHKNLWGCFNGAQKLITQLLDEITSGPEYIITLDYDGTYFAAELSPALFEGANRFYMVVESQQSPEAITESLVHIAKLSSRETLPILIAQSLPGVKLNNLEQVPQELPRKTDAVYFQMDHHGKQWEPVERGNNLALYWDTAPEDLKVELMIVRRN